MKEQCKNITGILLLMFVMAACSQEPAEIHYGSDECGHCKMIISDDRFAAQLVTDKGKAIKFDAIECMAAFSNVNSEQVKSAKLWVSDFNNPGEWLAAGEARFVKSEVIKSPMGESLLALSTTKEVEKHIEEYPGKSMSWEEVEKL